MALSSQDKKNIYTLLKTSKTYASGYIPKEFKEEMPVFTDDVPEKITKTSAITLDEIAHKVQNCHNCQLEKSKSENSSGSGCAHPLLLVVTLKPLSQNAEILLEKMLSSICLDKTLNCFVTSIIKCKGKNINNPSEDEINCCKAYLNAQVHILKPKYILSLGEKISQSLLKTDYTLQRLRTKVWGCRLGNKESDPVLPLITSFSPEELLENQNAKALAWQDLKMLRTKLSEKFTEYKNILMQAK